jgi:hypothetical protein
MKGLWLLMLVILSFPVFSYAKAEPDFYFTNYAFTKIEFLNQNYTEIENGRMIRIDGIYQNHEWKKPYAYRERLKAIGKDIRNYNILQFSIREADGVNYSFPIVLVWLEKGFLPELNDLKKGRRVALYGQFYYLKDSDYALELHVLETIDKGGRKVEMLLDGRMPPTPTPTVIPSPTPGPSLWKRIQKKLKLRETPQPAGTVTPEALPPTTR